MDLPIKLSEALLGAEKEIKTLDGALTLKVPAGVAPGERLRVRDKGVPTGRGRGDLLVKIKFDLPKKLSKKAEKLIQDLQNEGL
jgi:molecular chaperone DnaJ